MTSNTTNIARVINAETANTTGQVIREALDEQRKRFDMGLGTAEQYNHAKFVIHGMAIQFATVYGLTGDDLDWFWDVTGLRRVAGVTREVYEVVQRGSDNS